jgi:hypothetical protein
MAGELGFKRLKTLQCVRKVYEGLQSLLTMRRIDARRMKAAAVWGRFSRLLLN